MQVFYIDAVYQVYLDRRLLAAAAGAQASSCVQIGC